MRVGARTNVLILDALDVTSVALAGHTETSLADVDIIMPVRLTDAGCRTNSGVEEARIDVFERQITNCCVRVLGCVLECLKADGGVERAGGVV